MSIPKMVLRSFDENNLVGSNMFDYIQLSIFDEAVVALVKIANEIAELIPEKQQLGKNCVLGQATGYSLVKGAWQEWGLENIEMAAPLSPDELLKKRRAIFKGQLQKDRSLLPGQDTREFWQRAEQRNIATTVIKYDNLGMVEYEAIEAFKGYYFQP